MTIILTPETETKLRAKAEREGQDVNAIADALLAYALDWDARDREEAIAGIRTGLEANAAGRVRPASKVFAEMRAKLKAAHEL